MTAPTPDTDELLSAVLDGEASPDEEARVLADPTLAARLAELRAAAAAVAEPVTWPADAADPVAAALARTEDVLGEPEPGDPGLSGTSVDRSLAARRAGHRSGGRRTGGHPGWIVGAAAAALLLLVGAAALLRPSSEPADVASSPARDRFEEVGEALADMAPEADLDADDGEALFDERIVAESPALDAVDEVAGPTTTTMRRGPTLNVGDLGDLGQVSSIADLEALAAETQRRLDALLPPRAGAASQGVEETADELVDRLCPELDLSPDVRAVGVVTAGGSEVLVTVVDDVVIVHEQGTCAPATFTPLPL